MGIFVSQDAEHDEYICPKCGGIFRLTAYKVTLMEPSSWMLMHLRRQEAGTLQEENNTRHAGEKASDMKTQEYVEEFPQQ